MICQDVQAKKESKDNNKQNQQYNLGIKMLATINKDLDSNMKTCMAIWSMRSWPLSIRGNVKQDERRKSECMMMQ